MTPALLPTRLDVPAASQPDLHLRPLTKEDIPAWYAYLCLPEVTQHTSWQLAGADDLVPLVAATQGGDLDAPIRFAICVGAGAMIGSIGFHSRSARDGRAELAYDLAPSAWGRGIARAAAGVVLDWGFMEQGWQRIQATVLPSNLPSIRVLERCGFVLEGTLRHYRVVSGVARDFRIYARLPELTVAGTEP